jgi:PAS domain S-box-containing protein
MLLRRRKLWLWTSLAALTLLATGLWLYLTTARLMQFTQLVSQTNDMLKRISAVKVSLSRAETVQLTFIISGEEQDLQLFREASAALLVSIVALRSASSPGDSRFGRLDRMEELFNARLSQLREVNNRRINEGFEAAAAALNAHRGARTDELRDLLDELEEDERMLLQQRIAMRHESARRMEIATLAGSLLACVGLIGVAVVRETASRRQAEAAHQFTEDRYRNLVELHPDGIMVHVDGRIVYVNQGAAQVLGAQKPEELIGLSPWRFIHPAYQKIVDERVRQLTQFSRPVPMIQEKFLRLDGTEVDVEVGATPCRYGGKPGIQVVMRDITHRKRSEEQLRDSEAFLTAAQEVAQMGTWKSDPSTQGKLVWSKQVHEIFGIPQEQFDGRVETFFSRVHPDDVDTVRRASQAAIDHDRPYALDHRIVRPDGEVRWVHERARIIRDPQGKAQQMIGIVQDITERKLAEQRLSFMMQELDHRVKNNLATVLSIAEQSVAGCESLDEFRRSFRGRIEALARTHSMLANNKWEGIELGELIRLTVQPYVRDGTNRLALHGSPLRLPPSTAAPLCMAFHELATNAAKYGCLSSPSGCLAVDWAVKGSHVDIKWIETGGPLIQAPGRRGFGTDLIEGVVGYELRGQVEFAFSTTGLTCRMMIPGVA